MNVFARNGAKINNNKLSLLDYLRPRAYVAVIYSKVLIHN
jgi:hypothetical protein